MLRFLLSAAAVICCMSQAQAGYCYGQKVTAVILNDDSIYFTTDKSCPNWCQIAAGLAESQKDRMYSMLLTAAATNRLLTLNFTEAQACEVVPTYAAPAAIIYTPG